MDDRFRHVLTDPRFRRQKKQESRIKIDERFSQALLTPSKKKNKNSSKKNKAEAKQIEAENKKEKLNNAFTAADFAPSHASVDRYGRSISTVSTKSSLTGDLGKFYEAASSTDEEAENKVSGGELDSSIESDNDDDAFDSEAYDQGSKVDYARGKGPMLPSSSEEEDSADEEEEDTDGDEDREQDDNLSSYKNLNARADLRKNAKNFGINPQAIDETKIPYGEATSRLAVLNLDWENIEAEDLFVLFHSFKPSPLSRILSVKIFLSQFGRERIKDENLHGPPVHLFPAQGPPKKESKVENEVKGEGESDKSQFEVSDSSSVNDSFSDNSASDNDQETSQSDLEGSQAEDGKDAVGVFESGGEEDTCGKDFNEEALRTYQLERLRYYYAIVECDSVETARAIYENCDGREFEKTCNFLDLRYVPAGETFPDKDIETGELLLHKSCFEGADILKRLESYKPKDFTTHVLQHSKVTLTWDEDDPNRVKMTRAKFSKDKLDEMDFKAYLASTASESESQEVETSGTLTTTSHQLLGHNDKHSDMIAKYKQLVMQGDRKTNSVFSRGSIDDDAEDSGIDMQMTFEAGDNEEGAISALDSEAEGEESVFHASLRKRREKIKAAKAALKGTQASYEESKKDGNKKMDNKKVVMKDAQLALLLPPSDDEKRHFNMADIVKRDKLHLKKQKSKKGTKRRMLEEVDEEDKDTFDIQVNDPRFVNVLQDPLYAIDPSNPSYKDTKAMRKVLAEKQKRVKLI